MKIARMLICTLLLTASCAVASTEQGDESGVRKSIDTFYEGWNTHDADKMVSVFADDIDHIDVFGEWHKGKESMREELATVHAGPFRNNHKNYVIEKIRFLTPSVAVVQVSSESTVKNLGTYVLEKQKIGWLIVSFTNTDVHKPPYKN